MGLRESAIFLVGYIEGLRADRDVPAHIRAHMDSVLDSPPELHVKIGQIEVRDPADKILEDTLDDMSKKADNLNTFDEPVQKNAEIEHEEPAKILRDDSLQELLDLCNAPKAFSDIAEIFNCTSQTIKNYLKKHDVDIQSLPNFGMKTGATGSISPTEKQMLLDKAGLLEKGRQAKYERTSAAAEPKGDIHPDFTDTSGSFRNDGAITTKKHAGTSIGFVDDNDWPDIKKRLASGVSQTTLAHDYEVDESTMDLFVRRKKREELNPGE